MCNTTDAGHCFDAFELMKAMGFHKSERSAAPLRVEEQGLCETR